MTNEIKTLVEVAKNKANGDPDAIPRLVVTTLSDSDLVKGLQGMWTVLVRDLPCVTFTLKMVIAGGCPSLIRLILQYLCILAA